MLLVAPAFVAIAFCGPIIIGWLRLEPNVAHLAGEYWFPRMLGGMLAVDIWGTTGFFNGIGRTRVTRSEEHTSELQSLMRISYAVFCFKKKIQQTHKSRH